MAYKGLQHCFKPYYKWNTFNTMMAKLAMMTDGEVLNLIINGIPSIQYGERESEVLVLSFKPYYKWNTFNTLLTNV